MMCDTDGLSIRRPIDCVEIRSKESKIQRARPIALAGQRSESIGGAQVFRLMISVRGTSHTSLAGSSFELT